jgi:hypothetical protein
MAAKQKSTAKTPPPRAKTPASQARPKTTAPTKTAPPLTQTFEPGFWRNHWPAAIVFLALPFVLYGAALKFGYVLDDQMVIWQNAYVQKGFAGLREIFAYDTFMGYFQTPQALLEGGRYRPLSLATFAAEVSIFGKEHPGISHGINLLLYGLTGVVLYRVLLGLFPLVRQSPGDGGPAPQSPGVGGRWYFSTAFIASVLFLLHPLHVEVVANIKGRDEILALLGSLGALYATLKHFDTGRTRWLVVSGVLLLLGMLAKENALTFVAIIPLTIAFFTRVPLGRNLVASLPLLAAALLFVLIRYRALGYMLNPGKLEADLMNNPFLGMTFSEKFATIFMTLGWYVKLLFVPHPLTHDYYPYHVPKVNWTDWRALASLALFAGMTVWSVLNFKKRRVPAYAFVFFALTLSIVSNLFVSVGTFMNERFVYMPSVAFCLLIGWFVAEKLPAAIKETPQRPYVLGAMLVATIAALYAWRTWTRVPDWRSGLTLNESAVKVSENSARAHCFYAQGIYEEIYRGLKNPTEKGKWVLVMREHVNRALEIHPDYGTAWVMHAIIAQAEFDLDHQMDKLFHEYERTMDHIPTYPLFRQNMFNYVEYLSKSGGNPNKINSFCYRMGYERFYKKDGDRKAAIKLLEAALLNQNEDERVLMALAEIYQAEGQTAKAVEMRKRAEVSRNVIMQ